MQRLGSKRQGKGASLPPADRARAEEWIGSDLTGGGQDQVSPFRPPNTPTPQPTLPPTSPTLPQCSRAVLVLGAHLCQLGAPARSNQWAAGCLGANTPSFSGRQAARSATAASVLAGARARRAAPTCQRLHSVAALHAPLLPPHLSHLLLRRVAAQPAGAPADHGCGQVPAPQRRRMQQGALHGGLGPAVLCSGRQVPAPDLAGGPRIVQLAPSLRTPGHAHMVGMVACRCIQKCRQTRAGRAPLTECGPAAPPPGAPSCCRSRPAAAPPCASLAPSPTAPGQSWLRLSAAWGKARGALKAEPRSKHKPHAHC